MDKKPFKMGVKAWILFLLLTPGFIPTVLTFWVIERFIKKTMLDSMEAVFAICICWAAWFWLAVAGIATFLLL